MRTIGRNYETWFEIIKTITLGNINQPIKQSLGKYITDAGLSNGVITAGLKHSLLRYGAVEEVDGILIVRKCTFDDWRDLVDDIYDYQNAKAKEAYQNRKSDKPKQPKFDKIAEKALIELPKLGDKRWAIEDSSIYECTIESMARERTESSKRIICSIEVYIDGAFKIVPGVALSRLFKTIDDAKAFIMSTIKIYKLK